MLVWASETLRWAGTVLLTLVLLIILSPGGRPKNFPPGLPILPLLGSLLSMRGGPTRQILVDLKKNYGNVASFGIFGTRVVLVSGLPALKKVFSHKVSTGRPDMILNTTRNLVLSKGRSTELAHPDPRGNLMSTNDLIILMAHEGVPRTRLPVSETKEGVGFPAPLTLGVVGSSGCMWQEQRRFVMHQLRDLGLGKSTYEPIMMEEITELMEYFTKEEGQPIAMKDSFNRSVVNVLWGMVMGKRYPYHHAKLHTLLDNFVSRGDINLLSPLFFIPGFLKALPSLPVLNRKLDTTRRVLAFVREEIREISMSEDLSTNKSLAAVYLREIQNRKDESSDFHMDQLVAVLNEMFVAGMETTSSTLAMAIYLLTKYPMIQQRLQQELDQVVGRDMLPSLSDMERLPYTLATVHEVQRKLNLTIYALPHAATHDCTVEGYDIPRGTVLLPNVGDAMSDPDLWKNPKEFDPENFLNDDGSYRKNEAFLPYGTGKRRCAGEPLARQELFLFLACLLHRFSFTLVEEEDPPITNPVFNQAPAYSARAIPRGP